MLLFCVKIVVKETHNFELAGLKKKNKKKSKEKHFGHLVTSGFIRVTFQRRTTASLCVFFAPSKTSSRFAQGTSLSHYPNSCLPGFHSVY